jgi:epoxyqueuosine reductase
MTLSSEIESRFRDKGFEQVGFVELSTPLTIQIYEEWLNAGFHGDMEYLVRHLGDKREPGRLLKRARSAIVLTKNYVPHPEAIENFPLSESSKIASYSRGADYHHFLKNRMAAVIKELKDAYPDDEFVCFTDSSPVLERDLARRAGLGWVGKNTCLLSKTEGSLFFIAEIYTTLPPPQTAALEQVDHCGTCTRCLDACPTGALIAPRKLDARLCISYATIESRKIPEPAFREKMGNWLFGCDICQTVCPWNLKFARDRELPPPAEIKRDELIADLRFLLTSSNRAIERAFRGSAISRAGGFGLKRNALVVAHNTNAVELLGEISAMRSDEKLGALAAWAMNGLEEKSET